jgi:SAM-dependent methyltransferase
MEKNPPEFYGEDYLKSEMGDTGGMTRWEDHGAFHNSAHFIARLQLAYKDISRVLDVGCGRGFVVKHLRDLGISAEGCEYAHFAVDNSVCDAAWCDLTDRLPYEDKTFDLVHCAGVLSQFPAEFAEHALKELFRVSRKYLWANILVGKNAPKQQSHHRNVKVREWWEPIFHRVGWREFETDALYKEFGYGTRGGQFMKVWTKVVPE